MLKKNPMTFPPILLLLDVIGTVLLGLGLAKYFGNVDVLPLSWRFDNYESVLIGAGAALTLPLMAYMVKQAMRAGKADHH